MMHLDYSRRKFLRGLGTLLALPSMESLRTGAWAASGPGAKAAQLHPLRMAFIYSPNGKMMDHWRPKGEGRDFQLSRALQPLEKVKDDLLVISGLALDKARANGDGAGDHARANAAFLTGAQPRKTEGADILAGISVDQIAANTVGQVTRLSSLELTCDEVRRAGQCDSGYSCIYQYNLAWKAENAPLAPERNPRLAFERLFSHGSTNEVGAARAQRDQLNKSILDLVAEDARSLQHHLGYTDKQKLDEYLTSIRDIERRISNSGREAAKLPDNAKPTGIPDSYEQHIRLMFDLLALSFQTDTTRIGTFMLAHDGSNRSFPEIGVPDMHHGISHHQDDPHKLEKLAKIDEYYSRQLAYFLEKMKGIEEGEGSLLDHSMILFGSGISDPDRHNHEDLPVLIAGGANGTIKTGRHLNLKEETPMCNLYLSMLDRMGVQETRFGDSTGRLEQIA